MRRRGAAVVEFAVAAPLLMLVIFGCVEYAQLVNASQVVTNASRRGARMAARSSTNAASDVESYVQEYLTANFPKLAANGAYGAAVNVVVKNNTGTAVTGGNLAGIESGDEVGVSVSLSFDAVRWLDIFTALNNSSLQSTTVARRQ